MLITVLVSMNLYIRGLEIIESNIMKAVHNFFRNLNLAREASKNNLPMLARNRIYFTHFLQVASMKPSDMMNKQCPNELVRSPPLFTDTLPNLINENEL